VPRHADRPTVTERPQTHAAPASASGALRGAAAAYTAPIAPACPLAVAVLDRAPEHVGDRFDSAVRVPREPRQVILRPLVEEVVEQQKRVEIRGVAEPERPPQPHPRPLERRLGDRKLLDRPNRNRSLPDHVAARTGAAARSPSPYPHFSSSIGPGPTQGSNQPKRSFGCVRGQVWRLNPWSPQGHLFATRCPSLSRRLA
jgi:hypothetical protein